MGRESQFWKKILKESSEGVRPGKWMRVEAKLPSGFPDTIVQLGQRTLFVELKQVVRLSELPSKVRPEQATWNSIWRQKGGFAYVLCWVESEQREVWFEDARAVRSGKLNEINSPLWR